MSCPRSRSRNGSAATSCSSSTRLGAAAEDEVGLGTILAGGGPQVLQPRDLRALRLERHVRPAAATRHSSSAARRRAAARSGRSAASALRPSSHNRSNA